MDRTKQDFMDAASLVGVSSFGDFLENMNIVHDMDSKMLQNLRDLYDVTRRMSEVTALYHNAFKGKLVNVQTLTEAYNYDSRQIDKALTGLGIGGAVLLAGLGISSYRRREL